MTTGEGGMVLTTNKCIEERTRQYINLNIDNERKFIHADIGCNYRMTSLQAALGISQLNRVKEHIDQKIKIAKMYNKLLKHYGLLKYLNIMPERSCESDNCYWVYPILLKDQYKADECIAYLLNHNIQTRHFFYPLNMQPFIHKYSINSDLQSCPVAESCYQRGLYLPLYLSIKTETIKRVCLTLKSFFENRL